MSFTVKAEHRHGHQQKQARRAVARRLKKRAENMVNIKPATCQHTDVQPHTAAGMAVDSRFQCTVCCIQSC